MSEEVTWGSPPGASDAWDRLSDEHGGRIDDDYWEDIGINPLFDAIRSHPRMGLGTAAKHGWILAIPQHAMLPGSDLSSGAPGAARDGGVDGDLRGNGGNGVCALPDEDDGDFGDELDRSQDGAETVPRGFTDSVLESHVLLREPDAGALLKTLNGRRVYVSDGVAHTRSGFPTSLSSRVLFEESRIVPGAGQVHVLCVSTPFVALPLSGAASGGCGGDPSGGGAGAAGSVAVATGANLVTGRHCLKNHVKFLMNTACNDDVLRKLNVSIREFNSSIGVYADAVGPPPEGASRRGAPRSGKGLPLPPIRTAAGAKARAEAVVDGVTDAARRMFGAVQDYIARGSDRARRRPRDPLAVARLVEVLNEAPDRLAHLRTHAVELFISANPGFESCRRNRRHRRQLEAAVESYIMGGVFERLFRALRSLYGSVDESAALAAERMHGVTESELGVREECCCDVNDAIEELSGLNTFITPTERVLCVQRATSKITLAVSRKVTLENRGKPVSVSSDDLLPLLIYCVIQANPEHLQTNVLYMSHFYSRGGGRGDELSFHLASFEAAVEYLKHAGMLQGEGDAALGKEGREALEELGSADAEARIAQGHRDEDPARGEAGTDPAPGSAAGIIPRMPMFSIPLPASLVRLSERAHLFRSAPAAPRSAPAGADGAAGGGGVCMEMTDFSGLDASGSRGDGGSEGEDEGARNGGEGWIKGGDKDDVDGSDHNVDSSSTPSEATSGGANANANAFGPETAAVRGSPGSPHGDRGGASFLLAGDEYGLLASHDDGEIDYDAVGDARHSIARQRRKGRRESLSSFFQEREEHIWHGEDEAEGGSDGDSNGGGGGGGDGGAQGGRKGGGAGAGPSTKAAVPIDIVARPEWSVAGGIEDTGLITNRMAGAASTDAPATVLPFPAEDRAALARCNGDDNTAAVAADDGDGDAAAGGSEWIGKLRGTLSKLPFPKRSDAAFPRAAKGEPIEKRGSYSGATPAAANIGPMSEEEDEQEREEQQQEDRGASFSLVDDDVEDEVD